MKIKWRSLLAIALKSYAHKLSRNCLILGGAIVVVSVSAAPSLTQKNVKSYPLATVSQESPFISDSKIKTINVGVMAIRGVEKTRQKWQSTIDYLSQNISGYDFRLVPLEFDNIEQLIANKQVDFVLPNPGMYVELEWVYGVRRIATLQNLRLGKPYTQFGAVIFCRKDRSDIEDLQDLKGKKFMAVSEIAFGGWQIAWDTLKKSGIEPYKEFQEIEFGGSHDAVVYAVLDGSVDAGTVRTDTLERMAQEGKVDLDDFVILNVQKQHGKQFPFALSTQLYPEWPLAMMPHTPSGLSEKLEIALMEMSADNPAAKAGKYNGWTIPANYQPVHDTLRSLHVRPYQDWGKITWAMAISRYRYWVGLSGLAIIALTYITVYFLQRQKHEAKLIQTQEEFLILKI